MRQIRRSFLPWIALLSLIFLAGCGSNMSGTNATSLSITPTQPSSSPKLESVTLHTEKSFYLAGDTITVTVSNQSNQTISFADHLTNCTVILLQRQKAQPQAGNSGHLSIAPCTRMIATRMHSLAAGQHLTVPLIAPKDGWPTGRLLATLTYQTPPASPVNRQTTIASAAFTIGPLGL